MIRYSMYVFILLSILSCLPDKEGRSSRVDRLPFYQDERFTPVWMSDDDPRLDTFHRVLDFQLLNQDGEEISNKTFDGKIYVTDFFFTTCPGICPKMTANMASLQDEFLDDNEVLFLSHSVTPDYDSVAVLKKYAEAKGVISDKWHLVTGDQLEIYTLGRKAYFVEEDLGLEMEIDDFLHTENFVLIDKNRYIRGIYNGLNKASLTQLSADIRTLKAE